MSLTYKLKLPANLKIHSMIFITNLESVLPDKDFYKQSHNDHLLLVKKNHDIDDKWKSFYIEKLLDHHLHHYRCDKQIIKYLIKWTDYRSEFNEWYREDLLDSVIKLMLKYEICHNSNSDQISYLHKLLAVNKTELSAVSNNLSLKKQCCKLKQVTWYSFCICLQNEACDLSYSFDIHVLNEAHDFSAVRTQFSTLIHFIFLIQLNCTFTSLYILD